MWDYNEYFCINCGGHWGMMGAGDRVEEAPELKKLKKTINKVWKSVSKYLLPRSHNYTRSNCKKCLVDRCHPHHLSKREMREDRIATSILRNLKGSFN